jgi:hypothetical protein
MNAGIRTGPESDLTATLRDLFEEIGQPIYLAFDASCMG